MSSLTGFRLDQILIIIWIAEISAHSRSFLFLYSSQTAPGGVAKSPAMQWSFLLSSFQTFSALAHVLHCGDLAVHSLNAWYPILYIFCSVQVPDLSAFICLLRKRSGPAPGHTGSAFLADRSQDDESESIFRESLHTSFAPGKTGGQRIPGDSTPDV